MKKSIKIFIIAIISLISCKNEMEQKNAIFLAEMESPMGWNYLRIYEDYSFQFESRRLLKSTFFEGKVHISGNNLHFDYKNNTPDFGDKATIDGIFLTYTDGIYRELLEISLNQLSN